MAEQLYLGRALIELQAEARDALSDGDRQIALVRIAGVLARLGRIDEAKTLITQLRAQNERYEPRLSTRIIFSEGLIAHFESLDAHRSQDRFKRAHALSVALGDTSMASASAAWMADVEFRVGNIGAATNYIQAAFDGSTVQDHETRGRACMVLADLMCWSGMIDKGREWYKRARSHAVSMGDIGLQSSILFNSVSFRVAELVFNDSFDRRPEPSSHMLRQEVDSVGNLDAGLGIGTLATMVPALKAELACVFGEFQLARQVFSSIINLVERDGQRRLLPKYLAERAHCNAAVGDFETAEVDIRTAQSLIEECSDLDDLAVVHARLGKALALAGKSSEGQAESECAQRCAEEFLKYRQVLRRAVESVEKAIVAY